MKISPQTDSVFKLRQKPAIALMAMAAVMQIAFAAWMLLINNFAVETLSFTGREIGIQQSIREIPGFMAFAAVFLLFIGREQTLLYVSMILLGLGSAYTGYFPTFTGFLVMTFISSLGFHYYETFHQSLSLQWLTKQEAPEVLGKILSVGSIAQLVAFGLVFVGAFWFALSFTNIYLITGLITVFGTVVLWMAFPYFNDGVVQHKKIILRKRYWLYYALTFMGGARRQIFMVFAGFMMVERFGFAIHEFAALAIVNGILTIWLAPIIGRWIGRFGERKMLMIEYIGLFFVFTSYAFVSTWELAVVLYIIDHVFFAMAIAMKTYFQKIADPADIAPTAGVAFTINHIAAVFIPVLFGLLWLVSPAAVFLAGAAMSLVSLLLSGIIPRNPANGNEFVWSKA